MANQSKWNSGDTSTVTIGTIGALVLFIATIFSPVALFVLIGYVIWISYYIGQVGKRPVISRPDPQPFADDLRQLPQEKSTFDWDTEFQIGNTTSISRAKRNGHMYVIGTTGSGKSRALEFWFSQDMYSNRGAAIIDPHGDLVENIFADLAQIYYEGAYKKFGKDAQQKGKIRGIIRHLTHDKKFNLINHIVYIDPTDEKWAVAFNPIETIKGMHAADQADKFASAVSGLFGYDSTGAPIMYGVLRRVAYTLSVNNKTLLDASRLLDPQNSTFRDQLVSKLTDPDLIDYWNIRYPQWIKRDPLRTESALNKIDQLTGSRFIRPIIGQKRSEINFRTIMDEESLLLVNLAKGVVGTDVANIFGGLVLSAINTAAFTRHDLPDDERTPFYVYVDEFQTLLSVKFEDYLQESRKYGVFYALANQGLSSLREETVDAIFSNANIRVAFRISSHKDAKILAEELFRITGDVPKNIKTSTRSMPLSRLSVPLPEHTIETYSRLDELSKRAEDLQNLDVDRHEFFVKYHGLRDPKFDTSVSMEKIKKGQEPIKWYISEIKDYCIRRYSQPKQKVEEELMGRVKNPTKNPSKESKESHKPL